MKNIMLALALCGSVSVVANEEVTTVETQITEEAQPATRAVTTMLGEEEFDATDALTRTVTVIEEAQTAAAEEVAVVAQEEVAVIE